MTNDMKRKEINSINQSTFTDDYITLYNNGAKMDLLSQCRLHYSIEMGIIRCSKKQYCTYI